MRGPELWVWNGGDGAPDVVLYAKATNADVLKHPAVAALRFEIARARARIVDTEKHIGRALVHLTGLTDAESPMALHARITAARAELE